MAPGTKSNSAHAEERVQGLAGKVALVTGASRGIGRAVAKRLAADGALVAVHYGTGKDAAADTIAEIEAAGGSAFAVQQFLQEPDCGAQLLAKVDAQLADRGVDGVIHILVNNAGILRVSPFSEDTVELFDELFAINTRAPVFVTQAAVERMTAGGRVITVSSATTRTRVDASLLYTMTKGAVLTMSWWLAKELAPRGITVNAVCPGMIETELFGMEVTDELREFMASLSAFGRAGQPNDVASVVAFLASEDSQWVTAETIDVSGGQGI